MLAPLIIHDDRHRPGEQEIVLMLNDFSFTPPDEIFAGLKRGGSMPKMASTAAPATLMAGVAGSTGPDLNDVKYDAFLANDRTLADPQVIKVQPGGNVLLRIINGSSMSNYHIDLGQLQGELIAVDGFRTAPVMASRLPIAVAQRLDIRLILPARLRPIRCSLRWRATDAGRASCWPPEARR